jgi:GWxTD domain-containing protein
MRLSTIVLAAVTMLCVANAAQARHKDRTPEAERLLGEGGERWAQGSYEERRKALDALEQAAKLTPRDAHVQLRLAHAYLDAGYSHDAKELFEHITELVPEDADAWEGLGRVWKRDWLATLATASLEKSIHYLDEAARRDPARAQVWTMLVVLRLERGDPNLAVAAAQSALAAAPDSASPALAGGIGAYQGGRLAEAESLYTLALARLEPRIAARFRDVSPLVPRQDGEEMLDAPPPIRAEATRRFWSVSDPDPTTPVNEAKLEYWTRVARASLLFSDSWWPHWDARADLYVRYGPPEHIAYQPPGARVMQRPNKTDNLYGDPQNGVRRVGDALPLWYPLHAQVWEYPRLGMNVLLEDLSISQNYEMPRSSEAEIDAVPDPAIAARNGLLLTGTGRGTFAPLPPGVRPLAVQGSVSVFEGETGPRLIAHIAAPGSPATSLIADCVVIDTSEQVVQRASRALGASRCDPAMTRAGDFTFDLQPGRYRVALAVSDGHGSHGVMRARRELPPVVRVLAMSDVVLVCGPLESVPAAGSVRLDPNFERRIGDGEPLLAYFEVYRLRPDAGGATRFEYEYSVRSLDPDPRPWFKRVFGRPSSDAIAVKTPEEGVGPTRRQYLSVPTQSLHPGRYRLEVVVRDHATGGRARRVVDFVKEAAATPPPPPATSDGG